MSVDVKTMQGPLKDLGGVWSGPFCIGNFRKTCSAILPKDSLSMPQLRFAVRSCWNLSNEWSGSPKASSVPVSGGMYDVCSNVIGLVWCLAQFLPSISFFFLLFPNCYQCPTDFCEHQIMLHMTQSQCSGDIMHSPESAMPLILVNLQDFLNTTAREVFCWYMFRMKSSISITSAPSLVAWDWNKPISLAGFEWTLGSHGGIDQAVLKPRAPKFLLGFVRFIMVYQFSVLLVRVSICGEGKPLTYHVSQSKSRNCVFLVMISTESSYLIPTTSAMNDTCCSFWADGVGQMSDLRISSQLMTRVSRWLCWPWKLVLHTFHRQWSSGHHCHLDKKVGGAWSQSCILCNMALG